MKRKVLSILFALVLVLTLGLVTAAPVAAANLATNIDTALTFSTIQAAIDDAETLNGHTITVAAGTYVENVVVDKELTLQGAEGATIAPTSGCGVEIQASDVTVDGFDINTSGVDAHGIWISVSATGLALTENDITIGGLSTAIYADAGALQTVKSSGWLIQDNVLNAPAGCNLELYDVDDVTIDSNIFGNTLGSNVIVSSELFDLTGINFTNNDVQGNDGGSMVAFLTDFQEFLGTRTDVIATTMDDVIITGNTFDDWATRGLRIDRDGTTTVTVNNNNFLLVAPAKALANQSVEVDAENNWWGDISGPSGEGTGIGGEVSIDVDFTPWLTGEWTGTSVSLTAEVPDIVAISVDPTSIDFGTLYPGQSSTTTNITVSNIGTVTVDVDALVDPTGKVFDNLYLGGNIVPTLGLITGLASGTSATPIGAQLVVPSDYSATGEETATLIFEVSSSP